MRKFKKKKYFVPDCVADEDPAVLDFQILKQVGDGEFNGPDKNIIPKVFRTFLFIVFIFFNYLGMAVSLAGE